MYYLSIVVDTNRASGDQGLELEMPQPIEHNAFAHACYEQSTVEELRAALAGDADPTDMQQRGITADEWHASIELALAERTGDATDA